MRILFFLAPLLLVPNAVNWGFFSHKEINKLAIFTLPVPILRFYKTNIEYITEEATTPDKRRYAVKEEAPKHYLDMEAYQDLPKNCSWQDALKKYSQDTLSKHGLLPWHILKVKYQLTEAFKNKDIDRILRLSADLGHYIGDAHVPLHTTKNYNGQLTSQDGIHGLWESRLPELFSSNYDFLVGKAQYIDKPDEKIWEAIYQSHQAVDSVLSFEKNLNKKFPADHKYAYEQKGAQTVKMYSREYAQLYHEALNGQVERQFRKAIALTGSFWYTCWIDAGQPDLKAETRQYKKEPIETHIHADNCH